MAISYMGGKGKIGKWIAPQIPFDIKTYVEPFGGMFWVYFNMDFFNYPYLETVVYNDFNKLNSNLLKCSLQYDKFHDELIKYPCQEVGVAVTPPIYCEMFNKFQKEVYDPNLKIGDEPNFDIACKYVYVLTQVFSGSNPDIASYMDYKGQWKCKYLIFMDKLKTSSFREHYDRITFVENEDFSEVIKKYDSPTTYFYCDPPYYKKESYYSEHEFVKKDHERFATCIKEVQGKYSISYYEFPMLHKWYPQDVFKWEYKEFKKTSGSRKDKETNIGIELLIKNY